MYRQTLFCPTITGSKSVKTNAVYRKLANNKIRLVKCNLSAFQFVIIGFMPSKFVWFDKKKYYRPLFYLASTVPNLTQTHWTISTNPNRYYRLLKYYRKINSHTTLNIDMDASQFFFTVNSWKTRTIFIDEILRNSTHINKPQ